MFVGDFERSVDANGRVALPSAFRDEIDDPRCYLTRDNRGCLVLTPSADFEEQHRIIIDKVNRGELPVSAKQSAGVNSSVVTVDRQGRFTLDEANRRFAGIRPGTNARMAGTLNTIEIWRESRFATVRGEVVVDEEMRVWDDEEDDDE